MIRPILPRHRSAHPMSVLLVDPFPMPKVTCLRAGMVRTHPGLLRIVTADTEKKAMESGGDKLGFDWAFLSFLGADVMKKGSIISLSEWFGERWLRGLPVPKAFAYTTPIGDVKMEEHTQEAMRTLAMRAPYLLIIRYPFTSSLWYDINDVKEKEGGHSAL